MKYDLKTPCDQCPFRNSGDKRVRFLGSRRAREIADSLQRGETFSCHKTNDFDEDAIETAESRFCAGALILMDKEFEDTGGCMIGQLTRINARLGFFNPDELDLSADVFDTFEEFIEGQE